VPQRVAGALKDIHDEKLMQLNLADSITRFELINEASSVGLWDMTVIAGDPVNPKNEFWWSQQFRQMLGYTDEKDFPNILDSWASRLHPNDKERVLTAFAAHLNDRSGRTPYDIEYQLQLKGGDYRWFRATGATKRDGAGVPQRVAGALKDIHDEKLTALAIDRVIAAAVKGDLKQRVDAEQFQGSMRAIGQNMNRLLDSLSDSIRTVKIAIDQVSQASVQLGSTSQFMSSGSAQLNQEAERSVVELERVAAGVKANATNAGSTNQLVSQTAVAARGGEGRMQEMSAAMGDINSSAQQIARIIKVIDEIAFQTNLLALNAAVEAARAGRHGRGFAVVAQEVRSLAERSARAAKETAELIEDSVSKVAQGVRIADSTRESLQAIVVNVEKVVTLASEVSAASDEQSTALAAVSESMRKVNDSAQSGSQQSTEVAAAAEELSRQMAVLKEQMDRYQLAAIAPKHNLPAGITPEVLEQVAMLLRRGALQSVNGEGGAILQITSQPPPRVTSMSADPRALLPLDRDERGFDSF
jgi:PAS domain S-box-containing protein